MMVSWLEAYMFLPEGLERPHKLDVGENTFLNSMHLRLGLRHKKQATIIFV